MKQNLQALKSEMRTCTLCSGLPLGPNPIFQLDPDVRILIVGQAPGRITHQKNRPFDDPSGDRLRQWLGVEKAEFYTDPRIGIFPMALCYPGSGKNGDLPPPEICAQTWRQRTLQSLEHVALTLVLGSYAISWHLPDLKSKTVTDAVRASSGGENGVFVLPHPSPRNNRWLKTNPWFEADVIPRIQHHVRQQLDGRGRV